MRRRDGVRSALPLFGGMGGEGVETVVVDTDRLTMALPNNLFRQGAQMNNMLIGLFIVLARRRGRVVQV